MPQHAIVSRRNPKTEEAALARGIKRNADGEIVRSKEWMQDRVKQLQAKRTDSLRRIENIDAEVAHLSQKIAKKNAK